MYSRSTRLPIPRPWSAGSTPNGPKWACGRVGIAVLPVVEPADRADRGPRPGGDERRQRAQLRRARDRQAPVDQVVGRGDHAAVESRDQRALVLGELVEAGEEAVQLAVAAVEVRPDHGERHRAVAHRPRDDLDRLGDLVGPRRRRPRSAAAGRSAAIRLTGTSHAFSGLHPRSIHRRPDRVGQPVRDDRGEDHERGDVEDERSMRHGAVEHQQREQHRRDPLGPEPGDERLVGPRHPVRAKREQHRDGARDQQRERV